MHASVQRSEIEPPPAFAEVSRATQDKLQDRQLTARVKAALIAAGEVTAKQILIETSNGIVSLSGPVDSETMKRATVATARSVHGVVSVLDQLFLRGA
jgi:hyperosmotically inducible periplasmic protein